VSDSSFSEDMAAPILELVKRLTRVSYQAKTP